MRKSWVVLICKCHYFKYIQFYVLNVKEQLKKEKEVLQNKNTVAEGCELLINNFCSVSHMLVWTHVTYHRLQYLWEDTQCGEPQEHMCIWIMQKQFKKHFGKKKKEKS